MDFIKIATISEFGPDRVRSFQVLARNVGIVRDPDGTFFATEISCKHQNADLTTGRFEGDIVTCPRHHWRYDIRTGECLNQMSAPLRRFELKIEGDDIYVSLQPMHEEVQEDEFEPFPEIEIRKRD